MSTTDNFDYYNFRIKSITDNIQQEIDWYTLHKCEKIPQLNVYMEYLKKRIGKNTPIINMTYTKYDTKGNKCELKNIDIEQYSKDMDIFVFKKPWNKMQKFHKVMKIKEFVASLEYQQIDNDVINTNRTYLINELISGIDNKKFNKNGSVVDWCMTNLKINSISCLDYNKKKNIYEIDWSN